MKKDNKVSTGATTSVDEKIKLGTTFNSHYIDDDNNIHIGFSMIKERDSDVILVNVPDLVIPVTDMTFYCSPFDGYAELPSRELLLKKVHRFWSEKEQKYMDDPSGAYYAIEKLKEKPKELTIEEIEKKLGYKIKIVGDKNA